MSDSWTPTRRSAFTSRCKADFGFDPDKDGELIAAECLGRREESWETVWNRFAESPALYPGVRDLLRKAMPIDLFAEQSPSWPQNNEKGEAKLRQALVALDGEVPSAARERVIELDRTHGQRREWVWAKLDLDPLANALMDLAEIAECTSKKVGGASPADMAERYAAGAWGIDAAALSSFAAVSSSADTNAVSCALNAIYRPWMESAALHLQALADQEPLPRHGEQDTDDVRVDSGTVILFSDGLRLDVSQRLVAHLKSKGRSVEMSTRWAAYPSVTATAKPAVSPVQERITGVTLEADFLPVGADTGRPLSTDRFRKLLDATGYQFLTVDDTGDISGRAWTEFGDLDKLGHSLQSKLAARIHEQIVLLLERIEVLLDAGWREVRVVTDHGWLWLPGGLPKVDLPKYLTQSRWARYAAIEGHSIVQVPTVPCYWNAGERAAVGPGIACFGVGNEYAHGGLSLQESLIPVLRVTPGAASATVGVRITTVIWVGLRCRIRIDPARPGLSADLRTRVNDADSSAAGTRQVDAEGAASLLVADDELEGMSAVVVILDADSKVIARQSTTIGGEG